MFEIHYRTVSLSSQRMMETSLRSRPRQIASMPECPPMSIRGKSSRTSSWVIPEARYSSKRFPKCRESCCLSFSLALFERGGEHLRLQTGENAALGGFMVRGAGALIKLEVLPVIAPNFRNFQRRINVKFGKRVVRNIDVSRVVTNSCIARHFLG